MIVPCREIMPVIRAALERGQHIRLTVTGSSMTPFIHDGDVVELEPIRAIPRKGDVVLAQCTEERYVLHRVVRKAGDTLFLSGDAQQQWEGPFTLPDILGKAIVSYRNGSPRVIDCGQWHLAGVIWTRSGRLGFWLLWLAGRMRAKGREMLRRLQQAPIFRA